MNRSFPDGTSQTLIFAEKYGRCGAGGSQWGRSSQDLWQPAFAAGSYLPFQVRPDQTSCDPRRATASTGSGLLVSFADGSARLIRVGVSQETWWALCTPSGGEVVEGDW